MHKFFLSRPIEISCQNHLKATRKILNSYESEYFDTLKYKEKKKTKKNFLPQKESKSNPKKIKEEFGHLNGECAQLNLYPLLKEGRDEHPALYETAARILRSLYRAPLFGEEIRLEYALLDAMLEAAKNESQSAALEKLALKDKNVKRLYPLQAIYYRMLKGTKKPAHDGYPPLTEFFLFESNPTPLCLRHASIEMLSALFNSKAAILLYKEIHKEKTPLSKDRIAEICIQSGLTSIEESFWDLIDLQSTRHRLSSKKILVGQEGDVSLKKRVFIPNA